MNILEVTDKLSLDGRSPSCIALNLRDAYARFGARDCHLTVCNLCRQDPGADLLREAGLTVLETGVASASPRTLPALVRAARRGRADLIHAHGYAAANYGRLAARYLRLPVVVHEHALLRVRPHQYLFDWSTRRLTTRGVAISQAVARFMVRGRCVPADRIEVIPNGIDLSRFQAAAGLERSGVRAGFGWPPTASIVGCAARFRKEKGLHVLFDAVVRLLPRRSDLMCVMAGDGHERETLQHRAAAAGVGARILFPGFVDDMPRFMRALTLLAVPSLQEGLSFTAMEAMAAGTPVVASRVGGLPELIEHGINGWLVAPGDADALAAAIERLLNDEAGRRTRTQRAARDVLAYDLDRYADRLVALYRQLLDAAPSRSSGTRKP